MKKHEAERYRAHINKLIDTLDDETALEVTDLFEPWESGKTYATDDRVKYEEQLYRCVQGHTAQDNWTPDATPALWTRVSVEEWPEWVQPTGAQDAYNKGDKVSHNDKHWTSDYDANIWEPGVFGWTEVEI